MQQNKTVLDSLQKRFDTQYYHRVVDSILANTGKGQSLEWLNHPCTAALLASFEGTIVETLFSWKSGSYPSKEEADLARGAITGIEFCINNIKEMVSQEGESND